MNTTYGEEVVFEIPDPEDWQWQQQQDDEHRRHDMEEILMRVRHGTTTAEDAVVLRRELNL